VPLVSVVATRLPVTEAVAADSAAALSASQALHSTASHAGKPRPPIRPATD
jgi:hypothetical protein